MIRKSLTLTALAAALFVAPAYATTEEDNAERVPTRVSAPDYPRGAERRGIEGYAVISYSVTADGEVTNAEVAESDPPDIFDRAALRAVESWRFESFDRQTDGHRTRLNFQQ